MLDVIAYAAVLLTPGGDVVATPDTRVTKFGSVGKCDSEWFDALRKAFEASDLTGDDLPFRDHLEHCGAWKAKEDIPAEWVFNIGASFTREGVFTAQECEDYAEFMKKLWPAWMRAHTSSTTCPCWWAPRATTCTMSWSKSGSDEEVEETVSCILLGGRYDGDRDEEEDEPEPPATDTFTCHAWKRDEMDEWLRAPCCHSARVFAGFYTCFRFAADNKGVVTACH